MLRWFILIFLAFGLESQAREYIDISKDDFEGRSLGLDTYWLMGEPSGQITNLDDEALAAQFQIGTREILSFGHKGTTYWFWNRFYNSTSTEKLLHLHDTLNFAESIDVYTRHGFVGSLKQSDTFEKRILSIRLPPKQSTDIFIRKYSLYTQRMSWTFWSDPVKLSRYIAGHEKNYTAVLSILSMSLLFNTALLVAFRRRVYIYYNLYIMSSIAFASWMWSFYYAPYFTTLAGNFFGSLTQLFICLFSIEFLLLREKTPRLYTLLKIGVIGIGLIIFVNFFDPQLSNRSLEFATIFTSIICLIAAILVYKKSKQLHVLTYLFAFGVFLTCSILQVLMWLGYISFFSNYLIFYGQTAENILMLLALSVKIFQTEKERVESHRRVKVAYSKLQHSYDQLAKVFYPHQLNQIQEGINIENTMPIHEADGCVLCFDVVGSSKIPQDRAKVFLRQLFMRCNALMMENYDSHSLEANAFRVKEMGDGFLCSVGYPFKIAIGGIADNAYTLAKSFHQVFLEELHEHGLWNMAACSMGIAYGKIQGFFPESGTREYDLFGRALVLATRYESLRKKISVKLDECESIFIVQKQAYDLMSKSNQAELKALNLKSEGITVQDDEAALEAYIQIIKPGTESRIMDLKISA